MSDGVVVIVDLGQEDCNRTKSEVESLGVQAVVCQHNVSKEELEDLGDIKGFIFDGGPCKSVNGFRVEASEEIYESELPIYSVDHACWVGVDLFTWPDDREERLLRIRKFLTENCKLELNT